jgi:hypothetical protein
MGGVGETKLRSGEENVIFFVVSVFLSLLCVTAKREREIMKGEPLNFGN